MPALLSCLLLCIGIGHPAAAQSGSVVGATLCGATSGITLTQPVSDSVVTAPAVPLAGIVDQANQIEVRIDGALDSIIPVDLGQTSYTGSVQLSVGTHTIEVKAINVCAGPDATASAVVTYTPPPEEPSVGSETPTAVGDGTAPGTAGGVTAPDTSATVETGGLALPDFVRDLLAAPLAVGRWLNIDLGGGTGQLSRMSAGRAATLTFGLYLAIIGLSQKIAAAIIGIPAIARQFPGKMPPADRVRAARRVGRVAGLILIIGALLL